MQRAGIAYFAKQDPDAVAIAEFSGRTITRRNFVSMSNRLAHALRGLGLAEGDRIAIVAPNCVEYLAAYFAGVRSGCYVVPVNWHMADDEIGFILNHSNAGLILAHQRLGRDRLRRLAAAAGPRRVWLLSGRMPGFESLADVVSQQPQSGPETGRMGRVMAYTSATTGRPKAVRLPLDNARRAARRIIRWHLSLGIAFEQDNVHLCASMLYHSAPLEGAVTALRMGHKLVLMDRWTAASILQAIDRFRVTTSFMVPAMFVRILKLPQPVRDRCAVTSLRFIAHGGAPCPVDVKRRMLAWWGPILWECYGATEVQGTIAAPWDWLKHPGTVGKPIPGTRIRILDDDGGELPRGKIGSIYLTHHTGDRFEYLGDESGTASSYNGDFATVGDLGYLNEDGFLFVCGRRADLIVSSGMNIYPAEIERALVQCPSVLDCAVIGERDDLCGEVPIAVVQLRGDVQPSARLSLDILRFLARRISPMKLPKRIEYAAAIPRDPAGKLRKRLLPARSVPAHP